MQYSRGAMLQGPSERAEPRTASHTNDFRRTYHRRTCMHPNRLPHPIHPEAGSPRLLSTTTSSPTGRPLPTGEAAFTGERRGCDGGAGQDRTGQGLARCRPEPAGIDHDPPPPSHHHPPALRQPGRDRPARAERSPRRGRGRARGVADAGPSERARRHRPRPGRTRTGRRRLGCAPRSPHAVRLDGP